MGYPGGKSGPGVFHALINLMPPHDIYIEPFVGGAGVMRQKRPARVNVGIDLDGSAIAVAAEAAGRIAGSGERIHDGYPHAGNAVAVPHAKNGAGRSTHAGSGEKRRRTSPETSLADALAGKGYAGLDRWNFFTANGIDALEAFEPPANALVYCDPPYLLSTRVSGARYKFEMTDADHRRLLRCIRNLTCRVMISGYSSALYAKELRGWNATAFQAATRGKPAAEWCWYNFDRPVELHDYRFLGENWRERENIRRVQRRWAARIANMPVLQRQALLSAMASHAGNAESGQIRLNTLRSSV